MPLNDPVSLGKALRLLRNWQGRTQTEIAGTAGISKAMLSSYETGKQLPKIGTLAVILDALTGDLYDLQDVLAEVDGRPPRRRAARSSRGR
jgi:transcriptional regulator with XRE-family HTH domain